jgi:predicted transcriptional regulator YdeE
MPEGNAFYFAGVKITGLEAAPSAFVTKIIPVGDYVRLRQKNLAADLEAALTYLYHTFLPKAGYLLSDALEIEHFGTWREILIPVQGSQPTTKE